MSSKPANYEMESVRIAVQEGSAKKGKAVECSPRRLNLCWGLIKCDRPENLGWKIFQFLIWLTLVATITFTPVIMKYSFAGPDGKMLKHKYTAPTSHTISFCTSILIGVITTAIIYGKKGVIDVFRIKAILILAPVSIGYAVSEALALVAMRVSDPIMYAVIHKIRLLETALMTRVFLRRHVSLVQWCICFTVTMCVLAFVLSSVDTTKHSTTGATQKSDPMGPILLLLNISISVACSIYADWSYKKLAYPLPIQMASGRITAAMGSASLAIGMITYHGWWSYGWFGGPDGGWDGKVCLLLGFLIFRDWTTSCVLLHLDALWKAMAGSVAVATTYIADVIIMGKYFNASLFCLVLAIMFAVTIYAFVKMLEKQMKALEQTNKELKKAAALAAGETDSPHSDATTA